MVSPTDASAGLTTDIWQRMKDGGLVRVHMDYSPARKIAPKKMENLRGELSQKMRRNSGKLRQNYLYFTVQFLSKVIAVKTQQTSTCPYRLVLPAGKLCRKKW